MGDRRVTTDTEILRDDEGAEYRIIVRRRLEIRCPYCRRYTDDDLDSCLECGAPLFVGRLDP